MDYYSTLGLNKNASKQDIRKAYKKLSMRHHPDRGGDENQFKKINEAYSILSDPQKRAAYDNPQPRFNSSNFGGGNPFGGNYDNIFHEFFRQAAQPHHYNNRVQRNKDIRLTYEISLEDCYTGKEAILRYKLVNGTSKEVNVNIPPGAKNGDVIRFEGLGDNTIKHMPKGNLLLNIKVRNTSGWRVDGLNLHGTIKIPIWDFITGTQYIIDLPSKKSIQLNIPKGTQTGTTFSIHNHGLPNIKTGKYGIVYVKVNGIIPKISDEAILQQIDNIRSQTT